MRAKIKKGLHLLFLDGCKFDNITDFIIINFANKDNYNSFRQIRNHLLIDTKEGEIDIVFTGEVPKLKFNNFCKDQLVLKTIRQN